MSMTVRIKLQGLRNIDYLTDALNEMGIQFRRNETDRGEKPDTSLGSITVDGQNIHIQRNDSGDLVFVGDSDWGHFQSERFRNKVRQNYSVAAVKYKVDEMGYHLADIQTLQDGTVKILARAWG
jgi:hypothetical protein